MSVRVRVNGRERDLPDEATLVTVVELLGGSPDGRGIAVALDGEVVPRRTWAHTALRAGMAVEVLTAVQGG